MLKGRLAYGWHRGLLGPPAKGTTYSMDVPGAEPTGNAGTGIIYLGADSTKATVSASVPKNIDEVAYPAQVGLYFIDATGTLTSDWNGSAVTGFGGLLALANYQCPT